MPIACNEDCNKFALSSVDWALLRPGFWIWASTWKINGWCTTQIMVTWHHDSITCWMKCTQYKTNAWGITCCINAWWSGDCAWLISAMRIHWFAEAIVRHIASLCLPYFRGCNLGLQVVLLWLFGVLCHHLCCLATTFAVLPCHHLCCAACLSQRFPCCLSCNICCLCCNLGFGNFLFFVLGKLFPG